MVASEDGSPRRVVLVCGPPCAGKSSFVAARAGPGDVVVDYDVIAREMGSPVPWDHGEVHRLLARARRDALENEIARMRSGTAWVIRSAADAGRRAVLARRLRAEVVVLDVPPDEAKRRAAADGRPPWTADAIDRWWRRYSP